MCVCVCVCVCVSVAAWALFTEGHGRAFSLFSFSCLKRDFLCYGNEAVKTSQPVSANTMCTRHKQRRYCTSSKPTFPLCRMKHTHNILLKFINIYIFFKQTFFFLFYYLLLSERKAISKKIKMIYINKKNSCLPFFSIPSSCFLFLNSFILFPVGSGRACR